MDKVGQDAYAGELNVTLKDQRSTLISNATLYSKLSDVRTSTTANNPLSTVTVGFNFRIDTENSEWKSQGCMYPRTAAMIIHGSFASSPELENTNFNVRVTENEQQYIGI